LIHATGSLPGWHPADEPPDPSELEGELVLIPSISRQRLAADWLDRLRATSSPPPVDAVSPRSRTIAAALEAASLDAQAISAECVSDFLSLGHAHLQVELLTRAMRYTSVLDTDRFASATVSAANAAVVGSHELARDEIVRAFDLLADARNHVYAVDFYVVDITLLAPGTMGEGLRAKLASGQATSLLAAGELLDEMARAHPQTLAELRRAIEAGTACIVGGMYHRETNAFASPEALLAELGLGQQASHRHLGRNVEVFGQFSATFSPLLPEILAGMGFRGALHATFDGGRLPRADQCKSWWGPRGGPSVQALAATPLDANLPETWLKLAERVGDTIAHDHVATVVLAGWPCPQCEYYQDLRYAARYGSVLGKLVTLEEYFLVSREPDDWTFFHPLEYPASCGTDSASNPISKQVDACRGDVILTHQRLGAGLASAVVSTDSVGAKRDAICQAALNPWSFPSPRFVADAQIVLPNVPGCGFATFAAVPDSTSVALAEGRILRNERFELTVSDATGGIQSLRTHRDRSTRVSQRLVYQHESGVPARETRMLADRIEITRNDGYVGEITSHGRLLDSADEPLAAFTQTMRVARGLPAISVDIRLEPKRLPHGDPWNSYYASRLAWRDEPSTLRRGLQWASRETSRRRVESPEWVEVNDGLGTIACLGLGLALHLRVGPARLDTLLVVAAEQCRRFQFAITLDEPYPTQAALGLLTADQACTMAMPTPPSVPRGWFLHLSAKNVMITHLEPLAAPPSGIRLRVLETEGRDAHTTLSAYRPLRTARTTDFRGNSTGVLSVVDGRLQFHIGAYRLIQIEAEW
jgi:alpha-mannosidase